MILGISSGCKKWLDVNPKTQIREKLLFVDEQGFMDALTGVYLKMGGSSLYGQNMTMGFVDVLGQIYKADGSSFSQAAIFNYRDANVKSYIANIWSEGYSVVANLNNILVQIDEKKAIFTNGNYEKIKGQALALRALMHFDLLRLFGTSPAVDINKAAIPYVKKFGLSVYPLITTAQVLDECLADLKEGTELLSLDKTVKIKGNDQPTSNYMNYWGAKGLEARMLLYKGDKPGAFAAAKEVIDNRSLFPFVLALDASSTANRDRVYTTEHLFALNVYKLKSYTEAYTKTTTTNSPPLLYTATATLKANYEITTGGSADIRYNYLFMEYSGGFATSKYWQDNIADPFNYLKNVMPLLRISEMFYIAAETAATPTDAVDYLNVVREKRGLPKLATTIAPENINAEILKEYKKEMYAEGQLFFYFKRLNKAKIDGSNLDATLSYVLPLPEDEKEFGKRF